MTSTLKGKKIILGVCGSIACYKSAQLVRMWMREGASVKVVFSPGASAFIAPLTFASLTGEPVLSDFTEDRDKGEWNRHVDLALWADLMVIAPLTANTIHKMACGECDSFLMAVYMSTRCKVLLAPAMDHDMFLHPATLENLAKLQSFGHTIIEPHEGSLASGLVGKGRMAEPDEIFSRSEILLNAMAELQGKKILVTAGPTHESIDAVRFIANASSGKMGFAIAEELAARGAEVVLVAGPVAVTCNHPRIQKVDVISALDMLAACEKVFPHCDAAFFTAAVADYRPANPVAGKMKKSADSLQLELVKNPDIARQLSIGKQASQRVVGFALETDNQRENALEKLVTKNLDMIALNSPLEEGAGFGSDTNKVTLFLKNGKAIDLPLKSKRHLSIDIVSTFIREILP
jgi:phosphopantothenoylcysteine decarboxylase/phosphopantothenate--cysteine ligase